MAPVTDDVLTACLARLLAVFEPGTKATAPELRLRVLAWRDACGDIPGDLFQKAAQICATSLKWMPKPVELRQAVAVELERRAMAILRVRQMLEAKPTPAQAFIGRFDRRPAAMLADHVAISRRRVGKFGAMPEDPATWWSQIEEAAAELGLVAIWDDWAAPQRVVSRETWSPASR